MSAARIANVSGGAGHPRVRLRVALTVSAVVLASALGGLVAVWSFSAQRTLSAGTVSLSVSPFHRGALDAYVPVIDWGVRFTGVRAPARLQVRVSSVDRDRVARVARDGLGAAHALQGEARDAIVSYLALLAAIAAGAAIALGALVAFALRGPSPRLRWLLVASVAGGVGWALVVVALMAPRGSLSSPEYYGHGSDIPVALRAVQAASRAPGQLGEEVDSQLLGLARLVTTPGNRVALAGLPRLTVASDLHNNLVSIPVLRQAAAGGLVIVAGDLSDRGTPLETAAVRSVVGIGGPVVFVPGNHDSDSSARALAQAGAIVLTRRGRLLPRGGFGPLVARVGGLRIAGYESPNARRAADDYRDRGADVTPVQQAAFVSWLTGLEGKVDIVVVHEPVLAQPAVDALREADPPAPLLLVAGHTHHQAVDAERSVTEVNGGTAGAGGTGNLTERQPIGLAVVTYRRAPFLPLAVDLVQVAPGTGAGSARRIRLDAGPVSAGDVLAPSPEEPDAASSAP